uniref:Queuosine 5'-phosphate N-glycosylase/hydrolase n=2 Tax=Sinocyclocheilus grahami TaxID=75366 RepID=A0A672R414_SINGR
MRSLVHVGHNYWHLIIATSFSQDNSSEVSPIMPEEFGEHLTRGQRPFLHPESLQILQIHSSMLVLLQFTSLIFYRVHSAQRTGMAIAKATSLQFSSCDPWRVFGHSNSPPQRALGRYRHTSSSSEAELTKVLRSDSDTPMPMLKERHQALTEAGRVLMEHGGSFRIFMSRSENDAEKMVKYIVENIPSYRDEAMYEGKRISFYKRAQILVADFWGIMEARGEGHIPNLDYLTMFADYRVPQGLVYLGALRYSDGLMETLKNGEVLSSGERREVEIRGCSIWCVERIRQHLWKLVEERDGKSCHINSALIDFYLWPYAKKHHKEMAHIPIHHTRCIYY